MSYIDKNQGRIEVITGCMFSGKTRELLHRVRRAQVANYETLLIKPSIDDRYNQEHICTHNGTEMEANIVEPQKDKNQDDVLSSCRKYDVVAIDELNFFEDWIVDVAQQLADDGKRVLVSGTDQTFKGTPFDPVHKMMAVADDVEKLTAVCEVCGSIATRNQRLIEGEPASEDAPEIHVGGEESYQARCRGCHEVR